MQGDAAAAAAMDMGTPRAVHTARLQFGGEEAQDHR